MSWKVTVYFGKHEEAQAFFDMLCASRQDVVPLVWRHGTDSKYAEMRSVVGVHIVPDFDDVSDH